VGYETISAAGPNATTLHWISSTGKMNEGELLLVDAGVEIDQLYTADITRTLPINGKFTETQRKVYGAVYDATQAAFLAAQPGAKYIDPHNAAMKVLAGRLEEWGLLPADVTAESTLKDDGGEYRRWMVHGTSHHLGLDVHDCASARDEFYKDGTLEPGMIFTIEPGLYFKPDDLTVPEEYRGIGVRIEDDILINADGPENLSAALPASPDAVEAWMAQLKLPTVE
jgi:Xaa-Pro aminopeptidase